MARRGMKPIDRLRRLSVPEDHFRLLSGISAPQISDALKSVTGEVGVIPSIKPVNNLRVCGRVVTVRTSQHDWGTSVMAIDAAAPGEIIFIGADGDERAVWGELTSKTAMKRGIAGVVIYGSCRDIDALLELDFPVFSRDYVPCAGEPRAEGQLNVDLECDGVMVKKGDLLLGDESGVVVVPSEVTGEVVKAALKVREKESSIVEGVEGGISLSEILGLRK